MAFRVLITGDTGSDECIFQTERRVDQSDYDHASPDVPDDAARVPAGAAFIKTAFDALFPDVISSKQLDVEYCPLVNSIHDYTRITLTQYARPGSGRKKKDDPWRIRSRRELSDISQISKSAAEGQRVPSSQNIDLVLVTDCGGEWRMSGYSADSVAPLIEAVCLRTANSSPKLATDVAEACHPIACIVDLDGPLPRVHRAADDSLDSGHLPTSANGIAFTDPFWAQLARPNVASGVCVICSSREIRHASALIARHSSWELSVETLLAELQLHDQLRAFSAFGHLIIRFGCAAALHIARTSGKTPKNIAQFVFAPCAPDGVYRNVADQGDVVGYKTLISASITGQTAMRGRGLTFSEIGDCIRTGLFASMRLYERGYVKADAFLPGGVIYGAFSTVKDEIAETYSAWIVKHQDKFLRAQTLGIIRVPDKLIEKPESPLAHFGPYGNTQRWEILSDSLNRADDAISEYPSQDFSVNNLTARVNTAIAIALHGHDQVLNRTVAVPPEVNDCFAPGELSPNYRDTHDCITLGNGKLPALAESAEWTRRFSSLSDRPIYTPIMEFGDLAVIDREEMEGVCSARNAIRKYARANAFSQVSDKPISVAVFGPPGSGKSFLVKQVLRSVNDSLRAAARRLHALEFNVSQFRSIEDLEQAATAISNANHKGATPLVFFDEFDCQFNSQPLGWLRYFLAPMQDGIFYGSKEEVRLGPAVFIFAGGIYHRFDSFVPDATPAFPENTMSHREFSQCKGPDFVSRLSAHVNVMPLDRDGGRHKCVIRRALLLRSIMKKLDLVDGNGRSSIDPDIAYALLTMDRYRHGARSVESLLSTCIPIRRHIEKASLPTCEQLNMHVDAKELMIRMQRGRVRRMAQEQSLYSETPKTKLPSGTGTAGDTPVGMTITPPIDGNAGGQTDQRIAAQMSPLREAGKLGIPESPREQIPSPEMKEGLP